MAAKRGNAHGFDPDAAATGSGLFGLDTSLVEARVVIIPVPFEATTSYGGGAAGAPAAILEASRQVDLLDREYGPTWEAGIAMLPVPRRIARLSASAGHAARPIIAAGGPRPGNARHAKAVATVDAAGAVVNAWVRDEARKALDRGQVAGVLGGDHSCPFGLIAELSGRHPGLGILHVDAHADLRSAYEGFAWSHASIFHNVIGRLQGVGKLVQVGVRDFGSRELAMIDGSDGRIETFFEADVRSRLLSGETWDSTCRRIVGRLPGEVYISFDIDGLSPDLCPHTGTPVPGGLSFAEGCHLLKVLADSGRRVVGFDLCEVVPGPKDDEWDANVGARVLYKLIGCAVATRQARRRGAAGLRHSGDGA